MGVPSPPCIFLLSDRPSSRRLTGQARRQDPITDNGSADLVYPGPGLAPGLSPGWLNIQWLKINNLTDVLANNAYVTPADAVASGGGWGLRCACQPPLALSLTAAEPPRAGADRLPRHALQAVLPAALHALSKICCAGRAFDYSVPRCFEAGHPCESARPEPFFGSHTPS